MNIKIVQYLKLYMSKAVMIIKDNKKKVAEFICGLVLAGIICTGVSCMSIDVKAFQEVLFDFNKSSLTYDRDQIEYINYDSNELELQTLTNDPQMLLHNADQYVEYVSIFFSTPVHTNLPIQIFWCSYDRNFTEEYSISDVITTGESTVAIRVDQNVDELRVDIGNEENIVYDFDKIVVGGFPKEILFQKLKSNKNIIYERFKLLFFISIFILLHLVFGIKYMFQKLFKYRWIVGCIVLIFLVSNKYNGDSLCLYNDYVQPNEKSEWNEPIFGEGRSIRSDEWVVGSPIYLSTRYLENPYGMYNNILRGTDTLNDNRVAWYSIYNPVLIGRTLVNEVFGFDYAYSFRWYCTSILCFLLVLELMYIISERNKIISLCATCMILITSYYLWWGFPDYFIGMAGSLVCFYYFFESTQVIKKLFLAYCTSIFTAHFALVLYPAWQVPAAYIMAAILVWMINEKWQVIKKLTVSEWGIIAGALVLCVAIIVGYLGDREEYVEIISQTVYPGARIGLGGNGLAKMFYYVPAVKYAYSDVGNPSELSSCVTLFPVALIAGIYKWRKDKKKDWLLSGLMIVSLFLLIYVGFGVTEWIAKVTFLGNSIGERAVDLLGCCQVIIFARVFATWEQRNKLSSKSGIVLAVVISFITVTVVSIDFKDYLSHIFIVLSFIIITLIIYFLTVRFEKKYMNVSIALILIVCVVTGIYIRPICKGTYSVDSKPIAKEINKIVSQNDGKWIALDSIVSQSYLIICGAPTINSVNTYPNLELFYSLDSDREYEDIYNRYAHIIVRLTQEDTSFELIQQDVIVMNLSYKDVNKIGVKYFLSMSPLETKNEDMDFLELYSYDGSYIYEVLQ